MEDLKDPITGVTHLKHYQLYSRYKYLSKIRGSFKKFYLLPHNVVNLRDSCMKFAMISDD